MRPRGAAWHMCDDESCRVQCSPLRGPALPSTQHCPAPGAVRTATDFSRCVAGCVRTVAWPGVARRGASIVPEGIFFIFFLAMAACQTLFVLASSTRVLHMLCGGSLVCWSVGLTSIELHRLRLGLYGVVVVWQLVVATTANTLNSLRYQIGS